MSIIQRQDQVLENLDKQCDFLHRSILKDERQNNPLDIDKVLEYSAACLSYSVRVLEKARFFPEDMKKRYTKAKIRTENALQYLRTLLDLNISIDQKEDIQSLPKLQESWGLLEQLISLGGRDILFSHDSDVSEKTINTAAEELYTAVRKYGDRDDDYTPIELTIHTPPVIRAMVKAFFPETYSIDENTECGTDENIVYHSDTMTVPLPQAISLLETEIIPKLTEKTNKNPGNKHALEDLAAARRQLEYFSEIHFAPRAKPFIPEKDFYTAAFSQFDKNGDRLITVKLPVTFNSGTNTDRKFQYIKEYLIKHLALTQISKALSEDYKWRKSLLSGRNGSYFHPSSKLNQKEAWHCLKQALPFFRKLENPAFLEYFIQAVQLAEEPLNCITRFIEAESLIPIPEQK
ncbi:MAG: hypothetical protein ACLFR1_10280 [Spirochaetia bacterium]